MPQTTCGQHRNTESSYLWPTYSYSASNIAKMVVGDGMLATAFIRAGINTDHLIIFASGVSNSMENEPAEFKRETDLLLGYSSFNLRLVYFSTVSIFDPSLSESPYIRHKRNIEKIIRNNFSEHLIIRLPNVVGRSDNPHTLTNFLYLSLVNNRPFKLYDHAYRYLIDLDDVIRLTNLIIQKTKSTQILNLVLDNKVTVPTIIQMLTEITGKHGNYEMISEGSDYEIDNNQARKLIGNEEFRVDPKKYNFTLLKKYYGNK